MLCFKCSFKNPESAKFCMECGVSMTEVTQKKVRTFVPEAERKRVTALFSDLSGYTAMTGKNDPELIKEITSTIFNGIKKIIKNYDGFIERFVGDGGLALFGVPQAHEDDPIRAINAAIDIHEFVKSISPRYETKIGTSLSMHSGINTGLAVTADVNPDKGTHGVTGNVINIAARLSDLAGAHEIFVGQETYKVCKNNFNFESLPQAKVKGKVDPIAIYKVFTTRKSTSRISTDRQVFSEIVGRDKELNKLALHVTSAIDGKGSIVNIIGEAGIGKSRLFAEFSKLDVVKNITLLEGKAISIGKSLPLYPIIDFLKNWATIDEDDSERVVLAKLESLVKKIDSDALNEIVPFVATMMGMKLSEQHKKRMEDIAGESFEKLIFKNLRDLLIKASKIKTLVIVIEDLHWADESSIELLEILFNLTKEYRILFVNVFRPSFSNTSDRISKLVQNDTTIYSTEIILTPLDRKLSGLMVNNMLRIKNLSQDIKHKIIDRTGGNPFFIEEVVRSFIDEGAIILKDNEFVLTDRINEISVPHTIADLLTARIDRLDDKTRELIKIASVIGRSFFHKILTQVASSVEDIDIRINYLKDIQLIRELDKIEELEYLFKHALAQEVAYKSLLHERRRELHLSVANSIETTFKKRLYEFYGMLAYHYGKGQDLEKTEKYLTKAGEEALRASASSEALNYLQEALKLYINRHGKNPESNKFMLYKKNLAQAYLARGNFSEAAEYFQEILNSKQYKPFQSKLSPTLKLGTNFFAMLLKLYLPFIFRKKSSDPLKLQFLDLLGKKGSCLVHIDSKQFFIFLAISTNQILSIDVNETKKGLNWMTGTVAALYVAGLLSVGKKLLEHVEGIFESQNITCTIHLAAARALQSIHIGPWTIEPKFDADLIDRELKNGEVYFGTAYLLHLGILNIELGIFNEAERCQQKLYSIIESYGYNFARVHYHFVKANNLLKTGKLHKAAIEIEEGYSIACQSSMNPSIVRFMGVKIIVEVLLGRIETAVSLVKDGDQLLSETGFMGPLYLAPFLLGRLLTYIELLKDALQNGNKSEIQRYKKRAYHSAKQAEKNSKKHLLYKTWIFKSIGIYYWLIKKQGHAIKWWGKAIKEGEHLKAHPDLSRTYYEVGKHLLESQSKYQELHGIDGKSYLKKAETLFDEMNLKKDLDDLERLKEDYY